MKLGKILAVLVVTAAIAVAAYFGLRPYFQEQNQVKQDQQQQEQDRAKQDKQQQEQDQAKQKQQQLEQDREKQKQTVADIRNTGTAMFSWLTDQVGDRARSPRDFPHTREPGS